MRRHNTLFVKSNKGNLYICDLSKKEIFPCHRLVEHFYNLDTSNSESEDSLISLITLSNKDSADERDLRYYAKKYIYLRENGYFSSNKKPLIVQYSPSDIEDAIENVESVVLEVTEGCNLSCVYCINGCLYNYSSPKRHVLDSNAAIAFMKYLLSTWDRTKKKTKCIRSIGFYGGEPLMNISLIKDVVCLCEKYKSPDCQFEYRMTTNATLIDKHLDYLVSNRFYLTISLDGDKDSQSYRVYANGRNSFNKVYANLKMLMAKYPEYWEKYVSFNSILHDRNNVADIHSFIFNEFGKIPEIHTLNTSGIIASKRATFAKMFRAYDDRESENTNILLETRFMSDPRLFNLSQFLLWYSSSNYYDYQSVLYDAPFDLQIVRTGTCAPFSRKIYLSARRKIYPCERINDIYNMGEVEPNNNNIIINAEEIADAFNKRLQILSKQCNSCYMINGCYQCMFQLDGMKDFKPICRMHMSKKQMVQHIREYIDLIESGYVDYEKLLKEGVLK